jgi:hypothetical protein
MGAGRPVRNKQEKVSERDFKSLRTDMNKENASFTSPLPDVTTNRMLT